MVSDGSEVNEVDAPVGSGPGALLREAREHAGLSLEAAAAELLLKPRVLEALERDDLEALPEPPFVRGYLRSFARLVGADEAVVLERYEALLPAEPEVTFSVSSAESGDHGKLLMLGTGSVAVLALVAVVVWWLGSNRGVTPIVEPEPELPGAEVGQAVPQGRQPQLIAEPAPVQELSPAPATDRVDESGLLGEPNVQDETGSEPGVEPEMESESTAQIETGSELQEPEAETAPPPSVEVMTPAQTQVQPADTVSVEMLADSWIEIYDAEGRRLLYGLEPAGARHQLRGTRPFRVFLGNAPGVEVEINGRPFDLSPMVRRDNTARFTLQ